MRARSELESARRRLRAAVAAKPGLRAVFTYADVEGFYIAKPTGFPDILEFQSSGLDVVKPKGGDAYYERLSWEVPGRYPADVILHDERSYSLQPDALAKDYPLWNRLPAVRAKQVGRWNAETVLSYQGLAAAVSRLAESVTSADPGVV